MSCPPQLGENDASLFRGIFVNGFVRYEQFNSWEKMPLHAMKNDIILDTCIVRSGNNNTVLNAECRIVKIECI